MIRIERQTRMLILITEDMVMMETKITSMNSTTKMKDLSITEIINTVKIIPKRSIPCQIISYIRVS